MLGIVMMGLALQSAASAPLSQFYTTCMASGGSPGVLLANQAVELIQGPEKATVVLTLSPDNDGSYVTVARQPVSGGVVAWRVKAGDSFVFSGTSGKLSNPVGQRAEYCLRVR